MVRVIVLRDDEAAICDLLTINIWSKHRVKIVIITFGRTANPRKPEVLIDSTFRQMKTLSDRGL